MKHVVGLEIWNRWQVWKYETVDRSGKMKLPGRIPSPWGWCGAGRSSPGFSPFGFYSRRMHSGESRSRLWTHYVFQARVLWTPVCFAFDFHDSRFQWYQPHLPVQDPQLFGRPLCPAAPRTHLRLSHSSPHRRRSTQFVCHSIGFLFQPCVTSVLFKGADTEQWMEKVHRDCCNHIDSAPKTTFDLTAAPCVDTGGRFSKPQKSAFIAGGWSGENLKLRWIMENGVWLTWSWSLLFQLRTHSCVVGVRRTLFLKKYLILQIKGRITPC